MQTFLYEGAVSSFIDVAGTADSTWDGANLRLYSSGPSPSPEPVLGDFVEADFTGYEAFPLTNASYRNSRGVDGKLVLTTRPREFICTTDSASDPVVGWYITNDGDTRVLASGTFDEPISMNGAGQALWVDAQINIPLAMDLASVPSTP